MFSLSQRFQVLINQAVTFSVFIIAFIVATSYIDLIYPNNVFNTGVATVNSIKPSLSLRTSRYFGSINSKPKENVRLEFDLDSDLTNLFNWNTKQVFVYLTAEYNNTKNTVINEVTFWDNIITKQEDAVLHLEKAKSKYSVWDISEQFSGKSLKFKLNWNIQPWVGPLTYGEIDTGYELVVPKKVEESSKKQRVN
ncbi:hypothetical protein KAFR_0C03600 [Kazachstania africana CBS 2517]|uniref:Signal peptidase subunit 3 n=1 Tax=Kazachstania africana (strain ATCC 22294 / BCRC 22015 / CBS 2517 / CECT 1963 / NBRC 1671 / NRRL Y-8276) TaxID=1071382 RepID=H2ASK2_KAZAF|nr:hypothetical protein KAFR_0C03600 [Kazachstania africana CBS 2517]CCF57352.1 hypothetical protein KAFR_0C03600 [Kazachstania africana CBS 2517]